MRALIIGVKVWRQWHRVAPMIGEKHWCSVTERHWRLYFGALGAKVGAICIGANPCANLGAKDRQERQSIDKHWRQDCLQI